MLAYEAIIGFSADLRLMAVPPDHPADIGAELFLPATFGLHQRSAAILAGFGSGNVWITMNMGSDSSGRQTQFRGDHGRTVSLQPHIVDSDFVLQSHSDTPSVMTAKVMGRAAMKTTLPGKVILRIPLRECR